MKYPGKLAVAQVDISTQKPSNEWDTIFIRAGLWWMTEVDYCQAFDKLFPFVANVIYESIELEKEVSTKMQNVVRHIWTQSSI